MSDYRDPDDPMYGYDSDRPPGIWGLIAGAVPPADDRTGGAFRNAGLTPPPSQAPNRP
jgi:hypothetical protein